MKPVEYSAGTGIFYLCHWNIPLGLRHQLYIVFDVYLTVEYSSTGKFVHTLAVEYYFHEYTYATGILCGILCGI